MLTTPVVQYMIKNWQCASTCIEVQVTSSKILKQIDCIIVDKSIHINYHINNMVVL